MCTTVWWRRGTAAGAAPLLAALLVATALAGPGGVQAASASFAPRLASGASSPALQVFGTCYFSLSPSSVDVGPDRQSGSFSVGWHYEPHPEFPGEEDESVCADAWGASSQASWISVSESGSDTVRYTVSENTTTSDRTGTVRAGGETFTVRQAAPCPSEPSVSNLAYGVGAGGGSLSVRVYEWSGCSWSVSDDRNWITATPSTVSGDGTVLITAAPNDGSSSREGTVRIGGRRIPVTQLGACPSSPGLNPSSRTVGSSGDGFVVRVEEASHCGYAVSDDRSWINTNRSTVSGGQSVSVNVKAHSGSSPRKGTVRIGSSSFPVTQQGACLSSPADVKPSSVEIPSGGGKRSVSVTGRSDCSWAVSDNQGWITTSPGSVRGNQSVTITAGKHTGSSVRTGTVRIGGRRVEVRQPPPTVPCPTSPDLDPSSLTLPSGGGQASVEVDEAPSCGPYGVSDNRSWITTSRSSVRGDQSLTVTAQANTGSATRTGTVTIGGSSLLVTQCPSSPSGVSPSALTFASGGDSRSVSVSGSSDCSWTVNDDRGWITTSRSSVRGDQLLTVTVSAHTGSAARIGTVRIGSSTIQVRQDPLPVSCTTAPTLDPSSLTFASGGGHTLVEVDEAPSCGPYSVSDNQDWITTSRSSVRGDQSLTVTVSAHTGSAVRTGTVTVGGSSLLVTQQPPGPCPSSPSGVSPSAVSMAAGGGVEDLAVSGRNDCSWTVSDDRDWITATPSSVSGGGSVTVSVPSHDGAAREGTVTVGNLGVAVTQAAPCPTGPEGLGWLGDQFTTKASGAWLVQTTVTGRSDCTWAVESTVDWIGIFASFSSVYGGRLLRFGVSSNSGVVREGTITVGSRVLSVSQEGAVNSPPTANAGPDQTVDVGVKVSLDGSGSTDADGDALTYTWTQVSGPPVTLLRELGEKSPLPVNSVRPYFLAPAPATNTPFVFSLTVTDAHSVVSPSDSVTVTVLGQVLTDHRDRLLADWAPRNEHGNDVCTGWMSLDNSAQEVFVWNTHRLHLYDMLPDVTKLYSISGKEDPDDPSSCGGPEANRTFLSMTSKLNEKLVLASGGDRDALPGWRESHDPACLTPFGECPHRPFHFQTETLDNLPTGQIQFFDASKVLVERDHYYGTDDDFRLVRNCGVERILIPPSKVCAGNCASPEPFNHCTRGTNYTDEIIPYTYNRDAVGYEIHDDAYSFEMDQDYHTEHDSSPSCSGMKDTYGGRYGDPGWDWQPSACVVPMTNGDSALAFANARNQGAPWIAPQPVAKPMAKSEPIGASFTDAPLSTGVNAIKAAHVRALRTQIDAVRVRFGLVRFPWTDPTIVAGVTLIKAAHLTDLRSALDEAYSAVGRNAPTYTDDTVVAGITPIKARHVTELRAAVRALGQ